MTKKLLLFSTLAAILLSGCDHFYINDGCLGDAYCDASGAVYMCYSVVATDDETEATQGINLPYKTKDYELVENEEATIWQKTEKKCLYISPNNDNHGCMIDEIYTNSKCECDPACPNNCDITGACCEFGFDEDGSCAPCLNGYDEDGSCLCSETCLNGCNIDGTCKCSDKCKAGCHNDGTCKCPDECHNGCNDDGSCIKAENCLNGINDNGACKCPTECTNGCEANGACKCAISCSNGCDATGQTCCKETCQNGCNSSGACKCPAKCANGCDISGNTCCDNKCKNGCELDGTCSCPGNCVNGCKEDGTCKPSEGCKNGIDENGACKCPDACQNGCDEKGQFCSCPFTCENGCDKTGAKCTCAANCVAGSACDENTGKCKCIDKCQFGCNEIGTCDAACETVECKGENEICKEGKCIDACIGVSCENADTFCKMGKCVSIDANENHMHDRYETAEKQGEACRKYADCDSRPGKGDGFCDSFIGYKCSTKCTSDKQCVDDGEYHYICRPDGRCAPDTFVTVWKIPEDNKVLLLNTDEAQKCDFSIDWGDGKEERYNCAKENKNCKELEHIYQTGGTYTVKIKGTLDGFGWTPQRNNPFSLPDYSTNGVTNQDLSPKKLAEVKAFGPVGLGRYAFAFCTNLKALSKVDIPDASKMTLEGAFCNAGTFNQPLEHWDVSHVTNMQSLFRADGSFNQPLDHWDTSNVTLMGGEANNFMGNPGFDAEGVFQDATSFNQPLEHWDTTNVTTMAYMFSGAYKFNQPIGNWTTTSVTSMAHLFDDAHAFDQPLNEWDTSNVTSMQFMFRSARSFNQEIENWNVRKVTNMSYMFQNAYRFDKPLNRWIVASVKNFYSMFAGKDDQNFTSFNQPLYNWNVAGAENIQMMFQYNLFFDQDISMWTLDNVKKYSNIFKGARISEENYCKIVKAWNLGSLGLDYTCE